MNEQLKLFPSITTIKVRWGEMDSANHVNNVLYLRWSETARFDYFENINIPVVPDEEGTGIILGWQDCKYIIPIVYPDTVYLGTRLKHFEKDRFYIETHFFSEKHQRLAAISEQRIVCYNYKSKSKVEIPEHLKQAIMENEAKHLK